MNEETCYFNYRCRKCGKIIAIKKIKPREFFGDGGRLATNEYHKHCSEGIEDGEKSALRFNFNV